MKLNQANYCPDCNEVFERNAPVFAENIGCPSCTNRSVIPLHMILFERANYAGQKENARRNAESVNPATP